MSDFDRAILRVFGHEGGYSNHPDDPGGATNLGITQATLTAARKRLPDLPDNVQRLSINDAKRIYEELYWKPVVEALPGQLFGVYFQLFDAYINHSPQAVWKMVQRVVGATPDGIMGPSTRTAVNAFLRSRGNMDFGVCFLAERLDYWSSLSNWPSFSKGWTRRGATNLRYLTVDL